MFSVPYSYNQCILRTDFSLNGSRYMLFSPYYILNFQKSPYHVIPRYKLLGTNLVSPKLYFLSVFIEFFQIIKQDKIYSLNFGKYGDLKIILWSLLNNYLEVFTELFLEDWIFAKIAHISYLK